ncbi:MAG TPA: polysaccharide deacetylase family protein [Stellaceae bacterium]|nr:polysaccharide deacetylase family protein [Stellaceae bacterium]
MNFAARFVSVTAAAWTGLADELDAWAAQGKVARLWWRDDDAVEPTLQLASLLELADGTPLGLAVIPAGARPDLANMLRGEPQVAVLQHGWRHTNHGGASKKSEFPASRPARQVADELAAGRGRLAELFGEQFLPVLAPPWNRFAPEFYALLRETGLVGLSGLAGEREPPPGGTAAVDVHLDLVDWQGERGFIGEDAAIGRLISELHARRLVGEPNSAIGILTHHLVMDAPTAAFTAELLNLTRSHRAARWVGPAALLTE